MLRPKLCGNSWLRGCTSSCVAGVLPKTSEPELRKDWKLLEAAFSEGSDEAVMRRKAAAESVEALP